MGQPSHGIRDVVYSITPEQVKEYHNNFYVGKNIVISGAGSIDAKELASEVESRFHSVPAERITDIPNSDKPLLTSSLLYQRDDEMLNTCFSVAFEAPTWNDPDFFAMNYFKRIIGEYRCDKFTGEHLNSAHLQYNSFHTYMGNYPDMIMQKPFYFVYSDTALFGNFIYGNEMYTQEMSVVTQNQLSIYAQHVYILLSRSTNLKFSEPEIDTLTIFLITIAPAKSQTKTEDRLPTSIGSFPEAKWPPESAT